MNIKLISLLNLFKSINHSRFIAIALYFTLFIILLDIFYVIYNTLYQMYLELKRDTFKIGFDPEFSYTWKRSSYLYEMWCYFKFIHLLASEYEINIKNCDSIFVFKIFIFHIVKFCV